jgi:sugar lactone lactonase YvrE
LKLRIYRVSPDGRVSVAAGTGVAGTNGDGAGISTQLSYPAGMAVDRLGALYVADSGNKLVRRISGGQVTTILTTPGTPVGLAFDREGNLFIADTTSSRLYRRGANGSISTVAGASPALDGPVRDVVALGVVCFAVGKQVMKWHQTGYQW